MSAKSIFIRTDPNQKGSGLWNAFYLPKVMPILLGLVLGPLVAILIADGLWFIAVSVLLLPPLAILTIRYPLGIIMIWMAVMPWFPFNETYKYVWFSVHRLFIPVAVGSILLYRMLRLKKSRPFRISPAELALVVFLALGLASIFITQKHWKWIFPLIDQFLVPFAAYWLVRFSDAGEQDLKRFIPLMLLLALAQYGIGLVSWFAPQALPEIWDTGLVGDRIVGTFRQPAAYACVIILFWALNYHDALNRETGLMRTLQMLAFVVGLGCLFFTFTRGVWLATIVVLLGLIYLYPKPTAWLVVTLILIAAVLSPGMLADEFAHAADRLSRTDEGVNDRLVQANAGKNMFYARPVFGWGFGNYDRYDWRFMERVGESSPTKWHIEDGTSHHTYLTILAEMGIVGFIFYAFPIVWWLALTVKALPRLSREGFWSQRLLIVMWLIIGAFLLLGQDIDMRFFPYVLTLFWMILGFIANLVENGLQVEGVGQGV